MFFLLYSCHSTVRHLHFETGGYDLGIFEQAISGYAALHAPISDLKGTNVNLLGDHFHPVVALVAPVYRIFPSPLTLLVVQGLVLALSVGAVHWAAEPLLSRPWSRLLAVAYGLSWGVTGAVAYEFHEIVFAAPLLALAIGSLVRGRHAAAVGWALPLLLVKEEMGATVAAVGAFLVLAGVRRLGVALGLAGLAAFGMVVGVVIPWLSPTGEFAYWSRAGVTSGNGGAPRGLGPVLAATVAPTKILGLLLAFAPVVFLALFSRITILAVPTLAWHLLATNPAYSGTKYHYGVSVMPVVYLAAADTLHRWSRRSPLRWNPAPRWLQRVPTAHAAGVGAMLVISVVMAAFGPYQHMLRPSWWHRTQDDRDAARAVATVPVGASVAAHNRLAAHLTTDRTVYLLRGDLLDEFGRPVDVDYVVAETTRGRFPITAAQRRRLLTSLQSCGYEEIYSYHGYVTLRRGSDAPRGTSLTLCLRSVA